MKTKPTKSRQAPKRAKRTAAPIDTSDIPPLTEEFFRHAVRNPFYKPVKQSTTVRIDADVLAWLRSMGPGYQTKLNGLLRSAMHVERRKRA